MTNAAKQIPDPADFGVGVRVRDSRQRKGLSLRALASALGISVLT
jgi:hypothetical protein